MCAAFFLRWVMGLEKKIFRSSARRSLFKANCTASDLRFYSHWATRKFFLKKFLRPLSFSVYTNPRSKEHKRIACLGS